MNWPGFMVRQEDKRKDIPFGQFLRIPLGHSKYGSVPLLCPTLPSNRVWGRHLDWPEVRAITTCERRSPILKVNVDQSPYGTALVRRRKIIEARLYRSVVHLATVEKVDFKAVTQEYDLVG